VRADRLLSILLLLQVHRRLTARELAKRMEVSERTILRDMDALSGTGVPLVAERGMGGGWSLLDGYQTKLTGLTAAEIQALFLARPARLMADLGLKHESEAASIKLEASLPEGARQQAEFARQHILIDTSGWRDPAEPVTCLPVLLDALWRGRRLRFIYERVFAAASERIGDPCGLIAKGSVWYLVAQVDGEPRTYRVSRMREAVVLDQAVIRPAGFDLASYWESSAVQFRQKLPRYYARFLANQAVMRWVRYRGWRIEEEMPDGDRVRVRMRFDTEEEAVQFALSFGAEIEVIEPAALREKVLDGARAITALYDADACYVGWMNPYASFLGAQNPLEVIGGTSKRLQSLIETLGPERAGRPPVPGKWSAREIVCHLADCELVFAFRLRQTLAEPHHVIQPFDQDHWAESYRAYDAAAALAVFSSVRQWNLALIHSLKPEALARTVTHPERGTMTLQTIIETMGGHDINHIRQIEAIAAQPASAQ